MPKVTTDVEVLKNEVHNLKETNGKEHAEIKKAVDDLKTLIEESLKTKAGKWVELWVYFVVGVMVSSAIGFFIYLVERGIL